GKTVRTRNFRLVSPPPRPVPIYVAALMPPMLELAGEIADGVILNFMPAEAVPRMLAHVRTGAARAGRDAAELEVVARFQTVVTDDVPAARAAIRQMMGPYFATSVYNRFVAWCGFAEEARAIDAAWRARDRARNVAAVTDDMVDRLAIAMLTPRPRAASRTPMPRKLSFSAAARAWPGASAAMPLISGITQSTPTGRVPSYAMSDRSSMPTGPCSSARRAISPSEKGVKPQCVLKVSLHSSVNSATRRLAGTSRSGTSV